MTKIDIARKPITFVQCDKRIVEFAPSWKLLMSYKEGFISWEEFTKLYKIEMSESYYFNYELFHEIADQLDKVEFICWCNNKRRKDNKCHRFILREVLEHVGINM